MSSQLMPNALSSGTGGNTSPSPFSDSGFASTGFMIFSVSLVMMMTPFVGLLYSGLSTTKNGLSSFYICMVAYSIVGAQWILFGYSLSFAEESSVSFIGNFVNGGLRGIESQGLQIAPAIPAILFALYQMQFACITAAIIFGSVVERIRFLPSMVFLFLWATVVYCPVAYWTWAYRGWLRNLSCLSTTALGSIPCGKGVFDFAGNLLILTQVVVQ
jgi:Amt family ammonium transporter